VVRMVKPKVAAPGAAVEWRTLGGAAGSGLRWVEGPSPSLVRRGQQPPTPPGR